jgi:hypothetical protein
MATKKPAKKHRFTKQQKFAISSWVNDQFETGIPRQIRKPPRNIASSPHWKSDPASGITGTVHVEPRWTVIYSAVVAPRTTHWWNMGKLPVNLR